MSKDLKWIDAIERVLEDEKKPLYYSDIADLIIEKEYRTSVGATPANTVNACLGNDIKDNAAMSKFIKVQRGTFTLKKYLDMLTYDDTDGDSDTGGDVYIGGDATKKYKNIIHSFGIAWNRNQVLWKIAPDLFGVQTVGATPVNFGKQIGVYLLLDGREIIYIGQAMAQSIGERLLQHTKDRLSGRWDRFSWFGLYSVNEDGDLNIYSETHREISIENIGNTLEAILIESVEPRQNRKSGNNFSVMEYNQHEDPEIIKKRSQKILDDLKNKL